MATSSLQRRVQDLAFSIQHVNAPKEDADSNWPFLTTNEGFPTTFKSPYDASFNLVAKLCEDLYEGTKQVSLNNAKSEVSTLGMLPAAEVNSVIPLYTKTPETYIGGVLSNAVLYSDFTVVVLDLEMSDAFYSYSGGDRKSWNTYRNVLHYNRENLMLLERGRCLFLPRKWTFETDSVAEAIGSEYEAPLRQPAQRLQFSPWNRLPAMQKPFELDTLLAYEQLVLPCFPGVDLSTVAAISEKETDAFVRFNELLRRRMAGLNQANSISVIDDIVQELQEGAAALHMEAKGLAGGKLLRGAELGSFTVSLATAITGYEGQLKEVAAVIGSASLLDLLREYRERKGKRDQIRKNDYYIPYIMEKSGQAK